MRTSALVKAGVALSCAMMAACGGGSGSSSTPTPTATPVNYVWNFDSGNTDGLYISGLWHISDVRAASAPNSLRYANPTTGTYDTGVQNAGVIVLPQMTLGAAPKLDLNYFLDNECDDSTPCEFDRLTVNVTTDEGATYTEVVELNDTSAGDALVPATVDLAAFAGQTVMIGIAFDTGDEMFNAFEGAYVDDIRVSDAVWANPITVMGEWGATDEFGSEGNFFEVVLTVPPAATVTIPVSSDTPTEGLVKGGSSPDSYVASLNLTFTPDNWNVPQTVMIKGVDDGVVDGDQLYNIVLAPAVSNDTGYNGVDANDLEMLNIDTNAACDGLNIGLGDDDARIVNPGFSFPFQGSNWSSVIVGSNGNLTFGAPDTFFIESVDGFLAGPARIAPVWRDLNPVTGGTISCTTTATSMTVSYQNVPEWYANGSNSFTVTLGSDGSIVIAYGTLSSTGGLVGITEGNGAADPGETNLSAAPTQSKSGTTYELFTGDFDLGSQTLTFQ